MVNTMKLFPTIIAFALLASSALTAQDIVGRWVGAADSTDEGGTHRLEKQALEIRNEGGKLTGNTINSRTGKAGTTFQVQQDGDKYNLYAFLTFEGGEHLRWKLVMKDGKLVGTFSAQHDGPKKWIYDRVGTMTLEKAEAAVAAPASK